MTARLVAIAGPLRGRTFVASAGETTLGRLPSNTIAIPDETVSREHCALVAQPDGYRLIDRGSRHGTQVDDATVKEQRLEGGERIRIGLSVFLFLPGEEVHESPPVALADGDIGSDISTVEIPADGAVYLAPERLRAPQAPEDRTAYHLAALLELSVAVARLPDPDLVQRRLVERLLEVVPADRCAILLLGGDGRELATSFARSRQGDEEPLRVSRSLVRRALEERAAILVTDMAKKPRGDGIESLVVLGIRAAIAAPVQVLGRPLGVLYLDSLGPAVPLDESHLQLAAAAASVAGGALERARRTAWLEAEAARLRDDLDAEVVGDGPRMREVRELIARAAPRDTTILLLGESGTGKEVVARAVHARSARAASSFVAINCAALPESLVESELFGHERGAFTGAVALKKGKVEAADGGTLFLDEVGELAPPAQAKLLRLLQEREFERVGGTRPRPLDVRIIAATNSDLEAASKAGRFRRDLYYRLNVVSIRLPPLRERREDIPALAAHFIARVSGRFGRRVENLEPVAIEALLRYDWPGNVRELENAVERAMVVGESERITLADLPEAVVEAASADAPSPSGYHAEVREAKRRIVQHALERAGGRYAEAARLLGIHPNNLHRLVRNLGLRQRQA